MNVSVRVKPSLNGTMLNNTLSFIIAIMTGGLFHMINQVHTEISIRLAKSKERILSKINNLSKLYVIMQY
jgi:hypothetical protein